MRPWESGRAPAASGGGGICGHFRRSGGAMEGAVSRANTHASGMRPRQRDANGIRATAGEGRAHRRGSRAKVRSLDAFIQRVENPPLRWVRLVLASEPKAYGLADGADATSPTTQACAQRDDILEHDRDRCWPAGTRPAATTAQLSTAEEFLPPVSLSVPSSHWRSSTRGRADGARDRVRSERLSR